MIKKMDVTYLNISSGNVRAYVKHGPGKQTGYVLEIERYNKLHINIPMRGQSMFAAVKDVSVQKRSRVCFHQLILYR